MKTKSKWLSLADIQRTINNIPNKKAKGFLPQNVVMGRVVLEPISTDKLKRGDIVKFNPSDKAKFVVAYITKDIVYFYPTRTKHPYIESDRQVPMTKLYSVIVYKLLNVKDLCK
jgi:hypothetical protein